MTEVTLNHVVHRAWGQSRNGCHDCKTRSHVQWEETVWARDEGSTSVRSSTVHKASGKQRHTVSVSWFWWWVFWVMRTVVELTLIQDRTVISWKEGLLSQVVKCLIAQLYGKLLQMWNYVKFNSKYFIFEASKFVKIDTNNLFTHKKQSKGLKD